MNSFKTMNRFYFITISLLCGVLPACSSRTDEPAPPLPNEDKENIVFSDDFSSFDSGVWNKETHAPGWTNMELQAYSPDNVSVGKDGDRTVLIITAERKNGKIVSGRVNSNGKKSFKYGKLEASIKLPATAGGLWPAFWLMGDNGKGWPACGEIDVMEMGDSEGIRKGTTATRVNTAIHYGESAARHEQQYYVAEFPKNLQDGNYHIYGMEWNEESIKIFIDGQLFNTFRIADNPYFHDKFYMLFNLAVGGSFTGITDINRLTALKENQKVSMYVDWVRIKK